MKSLERYVLVILVCVKCVASQCIRSETCDCHCNCCYACFGKYCDSCAKGWSGTTRNECQRQNIAYLSTATSVSARNSPQNAIDEDDTSYFFTKDVNNPQLTLKLPGFFNIRYIYVYLYMVSNSIYEVYVMNSSSSSRLVCTSFSDFNEGYKKVNITCDRNRTFLGDQIAIIRRVDTGTLVVYELKVYQCSQGTYGDQCDRECRNCLDNRCDGYTGVCERGCIIGWQGATCETKCNGNTYGKNCSLTCQNCDDCNNGNGCRECRNSFYGDLCDLECPNQCRNDKCYRQSGVCIDGCKDGHAGAKCETPCKENCATCETDNICISCVIGMFGTNCEYRCPGTCGGSQTCDKNNGVCSECNPGTFGPNCTHQCSENCLTGSPSDCDRNGTCISGCVGGWFGPQCDKRCSIENCEKCNLLSYGFSCEICNAGYYLKNAQGIQNCVKCSSRCVSCNSDLRCTQCIPKFTGNQCENKCNINCVDGVCELDGTCTYGCNNSKHGVGCEVDCRENCVHCYNGNNCTKCLPGYYGKFCSGICYKNCFHCTSYLDCEICKPGYFGSRCRSSCPPQCLTCDSGDSCTSCRDGWSGRLCKCNKNCENENCDDDGICQSGCKGSYYGERCVVSCPSKYCQRCDQISGNCAMCSKGLYGINCTEKCSGSCLERSCNMTGACLKGCNDGFNGPLCIKTHSSTLTEREKDVNIRKLQIVNLRLDNEKLQKEIQKLAVETEVLQVKKNYYKTKLQTIKKEHSEVAAKMEEDNES